jgi:hypothetical protein
MRTPRWPYAAAALLGTVAAAVMFLQHGHTLVLRAELDGERAQIDEGARLRLANEKLAAEQPQPQELARLHNGQAGVTRLRAEIEELKARANQAPRSRAMPAGLRAAPSITEQPVAASAWKNAGRATPTAATETALWAASVGDIDMLASALAFDGDALSRANALFATLPADERSRYASAERLVATLATHDIPLGSAQILASKQEPEGTRVALLLRDADNLNPKVVWLSLREDNSGWKLVVPPVAIDNYAKTFREPSSASAR